MTDPTQRRVWAWIDENGPVTFDEITRAFYPEAFCGECDREHDGATAERDTGRLLRRLRDSGHITSRFHDGCRRMYTANPTDELRPVCEPFGAGLGDVVAGDPPPDDPIGGAP